MDRKRASPDSEEEKPNLSNDTQKALDSYEDFRLQNGLCDNLSTAVVYQAYEDLRLIRKWDSVRVVHGKERVYLAGTAPRAFDSVFPQRRAPRSNDKDSKEQDEEEEDATQIVVPMAVSETLTASKLQSLCMNCTLPETKTTTTTTTASGGRLARCVTAAIVDDDSTTAYYRLFGTMAEIVHPQWKQQKKRRTDDGAHGSAERTDLADEKHPDRDADKHADPHANGQAGPGGDNGDDDCDDGSDTD